ncbi:MAG TPA: methyltransferase [Gemmatirosa sp.]|nr:methyltransferase [Gemmatirosa sp.]
MSASTDVTRYSPVQRFRVPLGFLVGAAYLWWAPRSPAMTATTLAVGASVALVGLLVRGWAAGHIVKNNRLATTGPYAHTRNPLYFGSFLLAAGFALAAHWLLLAGVAAFWLVVYLPVIQREAAHVRSLHPAAYDEWARHVPAFLPRLTPWRGGDRSEAGGFSAALYLRHKEWQAGLGYAAILAWLVVRFQQRA